MQDVFIYDHLRTPRGKGRPDGALHEIPPIQLVTQLLEETRDRNGLDTAKVDDIIMGCVDPVFEAGADIARSAAFELTYGVATTLSGKIDRRAGATLYLTECAYWRT